MSGKDEDPAQAQLSPGPEITRGGPLCQLSGKGLLQSGSWKRRHCVLDARRLFFYPSEDQTGDKTSHYIDLQCYDICEEAIGKDAVRRRRSSSNSRSASPSSSEQQQHVLVISSADIEKGSNRFFETGRVYLSAGTLTEMNEWISSIRSVMTALRSGDGRTTSGRKSSSSTRPRSSSGAKSIDNQQQQKPKDEDVVQALLMMNSNELVDCGAVKQRAKGPAGRRLPQMTRIGGGGVFPSAESLEPSRNSASTRQQQLHNRSFDFGRPGRKASSSTVYAYSSSSEDEQSVMNLSFNPAAVQDDELLETLCDETLLSHSTSTPALAAYHLSIPRRPKRRNVATASSSNTDDEPGNSDGLVQQHSVLLEQTAAIKAALAGLEADLGASRRDVGWLQENLTTVQSAAGQVADRVGKMQSQVANMERQISGAVKEAQQMQQRAGEALKSASDAERDFRNLENDVRELLDQIRRANEGGLALSISPITPKTRTEGYFNLRPSNFDFGSLLANKPAKSSLRCTSESRAISKSISFGPTTTFAMSPTTDHEDDLMLAPPVATSTLKKMSSPFLPSSDFNQNSAITP